MDNGHKELSQFLNQTKLSNVVNDISSMDDGELDQLGADFVKLGAEIMDDFVATFDEIKGCYYD